jgi:hypothetical protein
MRRSARSCGSSMSNRLICCELRAAADCAMHGASRRHQQPVMARGDFCRHGLRAARLWQRHHSDAACARTPDSRAACTSGSAICCTRPAANAGWPHLGDRTFAGRFNPADESRFGTAPPSRGPGHFWLPTADPSRCAFNIHRSRSLAAPDTRCRQPVLATAAFRYPRQ